MIRSPRDDRREPGGHGLVDPFDGRAEQVDHRVVGRHLAAPAKSSVPHTQASSSLEPRTRRDPLVVGLRSRRRRRCSRLGKRRGVGTRSPYHELHRVKDFPTLIPPLEGQAPVHPSPEPPDVAETDTDADAKANNVSSREYFAARYP